MLNTNSEYLRPEIMDVLRAFNAENEDFTHYFSCSGGEILNCIEYCGKIYDFAEKYETEDETELKRLIKRASKLAFYKILSEAKGRHLAWGALTGIRPTKLAYSELSAGRDFKPLFEKFCVSPENIAIVESIIKTQQGLHGRGGQDLYIGVPFCPTKCEYCSFITAPIEKTRVYVEKYIECLVREIYSVKEFITELRSVYIGGGTPFVLDCNQLEKIYSALRDILPKYIEYTVEAGRPDVFSEDKLKLSKDFGVTRICVNPQSFSDKTLEKIGRKHTAVQTLKAYEMAQKYGFDINIDLIAGLADENAKDFENSLATAIKLSPANITVHTLSLKSGAKLKENVERLNIAEISEMIAISRKLLFEAGYAPYYLYRQKYQAGGLENTGWTKSNKACLYNIDVMEEISSNVAVGANSISKRLFEEGDRIERYAVPKDISTYISKIDKIITERQQFFK
ncbi:MAG: coproporphyrinogen dehydrogenase HemZ [Clostridiales bacterium]|nr:coproporphyrinogen dehydrogenase HemZ [Clostridiales bacterium]